MDGISSDQFTFHLKKLLELELVEKTENNLYRLTAKGKEFINRFDTDTRKVVLERQAKLGVLVGCAREEKGVTQYLVQERLKQPYYGFHGFVTGKLRWGEIPKETAERELKEETGLSAKLFFAGIEHKMDHDKDGNLLEDKYFFIFRGEEVKGELTERFVGGKNEWIDEKKILKLPDIYDDVPEILGVLKQDRFVFLENSFRVEKY